MPSDAALLDTVLDLLSGMGALRQRKMFGGVYIYCDDLFIATIHDETLYFKANASTAAEFVARGLPMSRTREMVRPLRSSTIRLRRKCSLGKLQ
jgi:TfoX/Sxy family transcriptional regulator of competence genes